MVERQQMLYHDFDALGMHPNPEGVEVVVKHLLPFVTKNLDDYAASVRRPARP